ncbi:hypothetical protein AWR27_14820 [Spirosoma montaniterrae]|uniref:Uncharacterized protein n=2 Tax=Spirosoma montaniterrae TaxID=1178516 RepID=A0A1P9WYQ2_9BACT|nr:hypothetical protein AWR27_14820 [Spirosoma montaniterrae]
MTIACSTEPTLEPANQSPDGAESRLDNAIVGDTLAVVKYANGNFVSFYEFAPGEVAIRHSLVLPDKPGAERARMAATEHIDDVLDQLSAENKSLVDIYKAISTTPESDVMNRLAKAQARLTTAKAAPKEPQSFPDEPVPSQQARAASARSAAAGCAPDYYNDSYGAQWFIDHYINENRFRKSMTNEAYARIRTENDSWTKVAAMAADFGTGIHFSGERFLPCPLFGIGGGCRWEHRWGFDIAPRGVEVWYIYSDKAYSSKAAGYDPCRRVHLGVCNDTPNINAWNF